MSETKDIRALTKRLERLVVFRSVFDDPTARALLNTLKAASAGDEDAAARSYCDFLSGLYARGGELSQYISELVLKSDNIYIRKAASGTDGKMLKECAEYELSVLEELSQIGCSELLGFIGEEDFLPRYETGSLSIADMYAERVKNAAKLGFGIYAEHHVFVWKNDAVTPVKNPDDIRISQLFGYESQRRTVVENTLCLLGGKPHNNLLLYGDAGTGKSSTVKAVANEYASEGLRLIEIKKEQLASLPEIIEALEDEPLKFIIFIDDLSFSGGVGASGRSGGAGTDDYAALKSILEGGVSSLSENICIYATSNRRHLVRESFADRAGDEIHVGDSIQETVSLSERFGLTVTFTKPDKRLYLKIVKDLAEQYKLGISDGELYSEAERFALSKSGRSPRAARQFIEYLKGREQ